MKNIKENLFWAFFYNVLCIPLAAGVFIPVFGLELNPMIGAAAMSLSSLFVVTNALRLNFYDIRKRRKPKSVKTVDLPEINGSVNTYDNKETTLEKETEEMKKTVYIKGMMCQHCAAHVTKALNATDGVKDTAVDLEGEKAVITLEKEVDDKAIRSAVEGAGYEVVKIEG